MERLNIKGGITFFILISLVFSGLFLIPERKALAEKSTSYFIILKVDHVDSLSEVGDQKTIMERAIELLRGKLDNLKLKSAELKRKSKDIIILSYQGSDDPRGVAQALAPKDLVVSFTVIGIFKGQEISGVPPR